VSLGTCAITVVTATARVECTGSTTWTPKVGGGARTERRQWRFELARTGSDWAIVGAEAR